MHRAHIDVSCPCIPYMLADGPPRSEMYPLKSGIFVTCRASARMDSLLRDAMNLPWWADIVQNAHPPKHPRCMFMEWRIISYAGIGLPL